MNDWRAVVASLANDDMRRVAATAMLGMAVGPLLDELSPSRRRHVVSGLVASGILAEVQGVLTFDKGVFSRVLASVPVQRKTGIDRFFTDGRLVQYPASPALRSEVLSIIASRVFEPGVAMDEATVNERLAQVRDDHVVLRRYLVDHGLLERDREGRTYRLAS